jgi:N-formylglutamate amidohydrolase
LCNAYAYNPDDVIIVKQGSMPVILTVPHDGGDPLNGVPKRTKGVTVRDLGTRALAERTASLIEERTGKNPYLVIAKFGRKYMDANRAEQDALESPGAVPAYRAYHMNIARFIAAMSERYPDGAILIDLHGQSKYPDTIFRGTRSGLTVTSLIKKHGKASIQGEGSILGTLQSRGYQVFPTLQDESIQEHPRFSGGYTVCSYGSHTGKGIDAIQLEFGKTSRANPRLPEDFADAILTFLQTYCNEKFWNTCKGD